MNVTRVLIVDDDALVITGLRHLLHSTPDLVVVGEAADGMEVIPMLDALDIDVVVCDIRMRRVHGTSIVKAIHARYPRTRIILMSSLPEPDLGQHAINAGADAYFAKTAPPERIRDIVRGVPLGRSARRVSALTERENDIADRVARGMTNSEIGNELGLSVNSVKTYVSRVMAKLDVDNRVQLANLINKE